jgi:hypothetical protein
MPVTALIPKSVQSNGVDLARCRRFAQEAIRRDGNGRFKGSLDEHYELDCNHPEIRTGGLWMRG